MALPPLLYSPKTKTSNEVLVYANLGIGLTEYVAVMTDAGLQTNPVTCCGGDCNCPPSSFQATVIQNRNNGAVGALPQYSPLYSAIEGVSNPASVGDIVTHVCLPNPDDDFLICFDQGASPSPGVPFRPVPVKFNPVDHYVRQRTENTITLNDLFVADHRGLQRIRGLPCTIIIKITPEGSGAYQEIQYYCNVTLTPSPMNSGSDGNASIDISMDGPFSFCAFFTASRVGG